MNGEFLFVCSTFPENETARRIAQQLVMEKLAACVKIVPGVESIYRWQGKVEHAPETLVFFKTTAACFAAFQEKLKSLHPYDVPEIVCLPIVGGHPDYLRWISAECLSREE